MKLQEVLEKTTSFFKTKGSTSARLDAEMLLCHGLGYKKRVDLYLKFDQPLKEEELVRCRDLVRRRSLGEPIAYIMGEKEFFGLTFFVEPGVLIPRPETETLAEKAIEWGRRLEKSEIRILDIGTGTGCLGIAVTKKLVEQGKAVQTVLVDKSEVAAKVAQKNIEKHELQNAVKIIHEDFEQLREQELGSFDLILSNPPYIAIDDQNIDPWVKQFEPALALFAEDMGLEKIKLWSEKSARLLNDQSFMGFEIGATQGKTSLNIFRGLGVFDETKLVQDYSGHDRYILGYRS